MVRIVKTNHVQFLDSKKDSQAQSSEEELTVFEEPEDSVNDSAPSSSNYEEEPIPTSADTLSISLEELDQTPNSNDDDSEVEDALVPHQAEEGRSLRNQTSKVKPVVSLRASQAGQKTA
ncbi:hypothetical protein PGT21_032138 [Puccinia graminis f. sp. tritici]|uniref:Uncharacterized protein n=1 Tax=Puccinia graminis f. sp. tritici TaxID=56615 RepID=A0A5B0LSB1_PUCGR|nr:hypothetical protein PGT21_032138 [Puccinia graminis f. sp. tritici]